MAEYLFSIRRDGNVQLDSYEGKDAHVVIPDHYEGKPVTTIADNAFSWLSSIRSVVIPDTVTSLSSHAFYDCDNLYSITVPRGVTFPYENAIYYLTRVSF